MNKFFIFFITTMLMTCRIACSVEQRYMPDGYIRDDVIAPYYKDLTAKYFQKVDSGKIKFDYRTYGREVERPLDKIIDKLKEDARKQGL